MKLPFFISWLLITSCLGCQVPVFRYALERWRPDSYELKLTYHSINEQLEKNLIDLNASTTGENPQLNLKLLFDQQAAVTANTYVLNAPLSMKTATALSTGDFNEKTLKKLITSPVRKAIIDKIIAGDSAVWVMLRSGNEATDAAARDMLKSALARAEKEISLPEGIVGKEERALSKEDKDNQLKSSIPLKISFSIVEVNPNDPAESLFIKMFTAGKPPHFHKGKVIMAPVFGRGRNAGPVFASELNEDKIVQACRYICGPCSCGIKEENPGFDLLLFANWEKHLSQSQVMKEKPLADLTGFPITDKEISSPPAETTILATKKVDDSRAFNPSLLITVIVALVFIILFFTRKILMKGNSKN